METATEEAIQEEVHQNFLFFQGKIPELIKEHKGQQVLIRNQVIIGYFETVEDAFNSANQRFDDGIYSIQEVRDEPIKLRNVWL